MLFQGGATVISEEHTEGRKKKKRLALKARTSVTKKAKTSGQVPHFCISLPTHSQCHFLELHNERTLHGCRFQSSSLGFLCLEAGARCGLHKVGNSGFYASLRQEGAVVLVCVFLPGANLHRDCSFEIQNHCVQSPTTKSANTHVCTHTLCEIPMATLTRWLAIKGVLKLG